jgi:hypothetical protein
LKEIEKQVHANPKSKVLTAEQGRMLNEWRYSLEEVVKTAREMKAVYFYTEGTGQFKRLVFVEQWAVRLLGGLNK